MTTGELFKRIGMRTDFLVGQSHIRLDDTWFNNAERVKNWVLNWRGSNKVTWKKHKAHPDMKPVLETLPYPFPIPFKERMDSTELCIDGNRPVYYEDGQKCLSCHNTCYPGPLEKGRCTTCQGSKAVEKYFLQTGKDTQKYVNGKPVFKDDGEQVPVWENIRNRGCLWINFIYHLNNEDATRLFECAQFNTRKDMSEDPPQSVPDEFGDAWMQDNPPKPGSKKRTKKAKPGMKPSVRNNVLGETSQPNTRCKRKSNDNDDNTSARPSKAARQDFGGELNFRESVDTEVQVSTESTIRGILRSAPSQMKEVPGSVQSEVAQYAGNTLTGVVPQNTGGISRLVPSEPVSESHAVGDEQVHAAYNRLSDSLFELARADRIEEAAIGHAALMLAGHDFRHALDLASNPTDTVMSKANNTLDALESAVYEDVVDIAVAFHNGQLDDKALGMRAQAALNLSAANKDDAILYARFGGRDMDAEMKRINALYARAGEKSDLGFNISVGRKNFLADQFENAETSQKQLCGDILRRAEFEEDLATIDTQDNTVPLYVWGQLEFVLGRR